MTNVGGWQGKQREECLANEQRDDCMLARHKGGDWTECGVTGTGVRFCPPQVGASGVQSWAVTGGTHPSSAGKLKLVVKLSDFLACAPRARILRERFMCRRHLFTEAQTPLKHTGQRSQHKQKEKRTRIHEIKGKGWIGESYSGAKCTQRSKSQL